MAQERGVGDQDKNQITAPHWLTPPVNQETWIGLLGASPMRHVGLLSFWPCPRERATQLPGCVINVL